MTEPTNSEILDAVTLELSRFSSEVLAEMHRLRDELATERQRTDQLESTVTSLTASLRKFDTQAAHIVDHITKLSADVDRRLDNVERPDNDRPTSKAAAAAHEPVAVVAVDEPAVQAESTALDDDAIHFAPLTLTLDPIEPEAERDVSIDDLVARVVEAIDVPTSPRSDQVSNHGRAESGSAR